MASAANVRYRKAKCSCRVLATEMALHLVADPRCGTSSDPSFLRQQETNRRVGSSTWAKLLIGRLGLVRRFFPGCFSVPARLPQTLLPSTSKLFIVEEDIAECALGFIQQRVKDQGHIRIVKVWSSELSLRRRRCSLAVCIHATMEDDLCLAHRLARAVIGTSRNSWPRRSEIAARPCAAELR